MREEPEARKVVSHTHWELQAVRWVFGSSVRTVATPFAVTAAVTLDGLSNPHATLAAGCPRSGGQPTTRSKGDREMDTVSIHLTTLADTVRRALAKFPDERDRIERGAMIVAKGQAAPTGPDTFGVVSQTRPDMHYVVTVDRAACWARACSCPDAQYRSGRQCLHQWAATILMVAEERQRRLDVRARFAALTDAELTALSAWKRRYNAESMAS